MPESRAHKRLVQALYEHVLATWMVGQERTVFLDADQHTKPPNVNGFIPDLYAWHPATQLLVIGEAETAVSIAALHAEEQIVAFLGRCAQEPQSVFVLAVPWHMTPHAKGLLRRIQRRTGFFAVHVVVLEELSSWK